MVAQAGRRTYRRFISPAQYVIPSSARRTHADTLVDINLIEHNAKVGTEVAREMAKVSESGQATHASSSAYSSVPTATVAVPGQSSGPGTTDLAGRMRSSISAISDPPPADVQVQVFGSAAIDITTRPITPLRPGSTTPGSITLTPGGVGRNIAEAAQNLLPAGTVQLISTVGVGLGTEGVVDGFGTVLTSEMELAGLRVDGLERKVGERTAGCTLSLGVEGDLIDGVADMSIIETLRPETVSPFPFANQKSEVTSLSLGRFVNGSSVLNPRWWCLTATSCLNV